MRERSLPVLVLVGAACLAGCYYSPQTRRPKANASYLGEAEAEEVIQRQLAPHGVKLVSNMKLQRDSVAFEADGYDRALRVGYEYRSHEGMDFEGEEDSTADGLSDAEIEALVARQDTFREFFLIVPEGPQEAVTQAVDAFVKELYAMEVLKQAKKETKQDNLFPDDQKKNKELLPWEATGDLKKKREEMEKQEKDRDEDALAPDDDSWKGEEDEDSDKKLDTDTKKSPAADEPRPAAKKKTAEEKKKPEEKKKTPGDDKPEDVWADDGDEDF
ncbi:MAG TPA: hypothetical protein PK668_18565 [Myxococcota bacterium]|nr:hypothetical protein [Myxococcota bacterium]HRY96555.1 hypothetical protein [Myxococcota bacterium]HSA22795.1 hypothetical protein [Myxococcota bacterium]